MFQPIQRMWDRIENARSDSDTTLFLHLMYFGELLTKTTVAGLVAAIDDDKERHRYRQVHRLVRADGIGEWNQVADDVLSGPPSQYLLSCAFQAQRDLTQKVGAGCWQHRAVTALHKCFSVVDSNSEPLPAKLEGRRWLELFARLRNKTRGHGAQASHLCSVMCPPLEEAIREFGDNLSLFAWPWAYLHQNLSGKYRVTPLGESAEVFNHLKSKTNLNLADGVYIYLDKPSRVDLIHSNVDATDFYLANGGFNDKNYEMISYISGNTSFASATPWMAPANLLPSSETQGQSVLETQGYGFNNLPSASNDYVHRKDLEQELMSRLLDDRHPIITLVGRGGIGKTSSALTVLHELTNNERFSTIFWFSSRDIDLLPEGPKIVQPHVMTEKDIAKELVNLTEPSGYKEKGFKEVEYLADALEQGVIGPSLFVFDNFETVKSPTELYYWIDTYIRIPNKVLITSRFREFKGDYPVDVYGMNEPECIDLVNRTAHRLGITELVTPEYQSDLIRESDGHPYVIKVLLGEVAKAGAPVKVERIVANQDEILTALFERTYTALSLSAKRVFLTLCGWRSTIPRLAIEAVLLRPSNEKMDVQSAIEELSQSSFIEIEESSQDRQLFLTVPLVATVFGQRKLSVSPMKTAVEADILLLQAFGATQKSDIRHGIAPRVDRLFRTIAKSISRGKGSLEEHLPMLEFVARNHSPAWLLLARLHEEFGGEGGLDKAKDAMHCYLEFSEPEDDSGSVWKRLAELCHQTEDWLGEVHALIELCQSPNVPFKVLSSTASNLNYLLRTKRLVLNDDEKAVLVQRLTEVMEGRISEASWGDFSLLGWLNIHLGDREKAKSWARRGLDEDPENQHCKNLLEHVN